MSAPKNNTINYIELPLTNNDATKSFYSTVFDWQFIDYGPDYICFNGADVDGGFNRDRQTGDAGTGALIVLFADDLEQTFSAVQSAGAQIHQEIYEFPGGRRFHFFDPNGNEIAIWGNPLTESDSNG